MKALTIWQPWASLIACGEKEFETRSWRTNYRGEIAIHAAKKNLHRNMLSLPKGVEIAAMITLYKNHITIPRLEETCGCVIATAELADVWECIGADKKGDLMISKNRDTPDWENSYLSDNEWWFGDFSKGRYAWQLANVKMLDEPIPAMGRQGLWSWEVI